MKSLKYNLLEDFMESIKIDEFDKEVELTNRILDLGVTLEDPDSFFDNDLVDVGLHLASGKCGLYTKSNLINVLPKANEKIDNKTLSLYQITKELEPLNFKTSININYKDDREILYDAYRSQWEEVYGVLLKLTEEDKLKLFIDKDCKKLNEMNLPLLITDKEILKWYRKLYKKSVCGIDNVVVYTNLNGLKIKHIYIGIDLQTGVPYLYINKNKPSNETNDRFSSYRKLFIPLGVLPLIESIEEPLVVNITENDLMYSGNIGKISGFEIGSIPDKEIFEFLKINNLYERGSDVVSTEEIYEVNNIINDDKGKLVW